MEKKDTRSDLERDYHRHTYEDYNKRTSKIEIRFEGEPSLLLHFPTCDQWKIFLVEPTRRVGKDIRQ